MGNLTYGYTNPCRLISGLKDIYLAGADSSLKLYLSGDISSFTPEYTLDETGDYYINDLYYSGTYYFDLVALGVISLPSWVTTFVIKVVAGDPHTPNDIYKQDLTITLENAISNFGIENLYINLSAVFVAAELELFYDANIPVNVIVTTSNPDSGSSIYAVGTFSRYFYHFEQRLEQGSYIETEVYGENGSVAYNQKLEITLEGYDQKTKNVVAILTKNRLRAIVVDQSNNAYLLGYKSYITTTTADGGLGKTVVDGIKTTLTFEGKEPWSAIIFKPGVINQLIK